LATLLVDEIGKPISLAEGEVDRLALTFELAASLVGLGREELSLEFDPRGVGYHCSADRFPIGVVLAIVPYNWPYNLTAHKIAPALAVGNTIVVKPSPKALLSTYALGRIIHECGCPQGVVNVVDAPVLAVKAACQDSRVKMVSFTGSDTVGWELKHSLPPQTRCTLELGGDASVAVFADADQDWAVKRLVAGAFGYAGQICISIQHVWVQDSIYDEFALRLAEATRACPCGDPALRETVCGPLITAEAADRVEEWIVEAVVEGAKILAGGTREKNVIAPTLVANVPSDSKLATREVFGPVLTVGRFETAEQAIELINGSAYGLQAGVFTGDDSVAERCYRELDVGGVIINDYPTLRFDNMPYGGNKRSGFGREGVQYAMEEMSVLKARIDRG
jgi:acyl-CoA reductase-like NAD-dependent aldehyde dehydrogenase